MTFNKDLKNAIRQLPEAEKDKPILCLLKKDLDLANWLFIHNSLNISWLIGKNMPGNIADIEKGLRKRGYLK